MLPLLLETHKNGKRLVKFLVLGVVHIQSPVLIIESNTKISMEMERLTRSVFQAVKTAKCIKLEWVKVMVLLSPKAWFQEKLIGIFNTFQKYPEAELGPMCTSLLDIMVLSIKSLYQLMRLRKNWTQKSLPNIWTRFSSEHQLINKLEKRYN